MIRRRVSPAVAYTRRVPNIHAHWDDQRQVHAPALKPFEHPLLACTHIPGGCTCTWAWYGPARALARKFVNSSCGSRHYGAWVSPAGLTARARLADNAVVTVRHAFGDR
jgi:hypothetical protein